MARWHSMLSSGKDCQIDLDQVVAVLAKKKGHVEVFLRGAHSLTVEGSVEEFAALLDGSR